MKITIVNRPSLNAHVYKLVHYAMHVRTTIFTTLISQNSKVSDGGKEVLGSASYIIVERESAFGLKETKNE